MKNALLRPHHIIGSSLQVLSPPAQPAVMHNLDIRGRLWTALMIPDPVTGVDAAPPKFIYLRVAHCQDSRQHQFVGAVVASTPSSDGRTADTKAYRGGWVRASSGRSWSNPGSATRAQAGASTGCVRPQAPGPREWAGGRTQKAPT